MNTVITAIITGGLALIGVIVTSLTSNRKVENQLQTSQAVMETKYEMSQKAINERIEALTEEVRKHNNFASRMPVVEEQIKVANHRIEDLERRVGA